MRKNEDVLKLTPIFLFILLQYEKKIFDNSKFYIYSPDLIIKNKLIVFIVQVKKFGQ